MRPQAETERTRAHAAPIMRTLRIMSMVNEETAFVERAEAEMRRLADRLETVNDDVECLRSGNVLNVELDDGGSCVVNIQTPMREIWTATKFGGCHFSRGEDGVWRECRTGRTIDEVVDEHLEKLRG